MATDLGIQTLFTETDEELLELTRNMDISERNNGITAPITIPVSE
jgi:hypothetical protein